MPTGSVLGAICTVELDSFNPLAGCEKVVAGEGLTATIIPHLRSGKK
jgi:hypothetical protein